MSRKTMTRWFFWFGWFTDKLEEWLEAQAANGWHVVKADRALLRFHFVRGTPKKVRFSADYPAQVDDEYLTIYQDAGWQLLASGAGWYIWKIEYFGEDRPEAFNEVESLVERNTRLLIIFGGASAAQIPVLTSERSWSVLNSIPGLAGKIIIGLYLLIVAIVLLAFIATLHQRRRLLMRRP